MATTGRDAAALLSRHECKYSIPPHLLGRVRNWIQPFTRPDVYALARTDHRYLVTSLYLDSRDLALYAMTAGGEKNRFKLRMRWYHETAEAPVFVEIKKRVDQIVLKSRCRVEADIAERIVSTLPRPRTRADGCAYMAPAVDEFVANCRRARAYPMLLVRYWREAYESRGPDPVRVTFDTDLEYAVAPAGSLGREQVDWRPTPLEGAILEIKFTELLPSWVRMMIRDLQLQKESIPKYCLSIDEALRSGGARVGARAVIAGRAAVLGNRRAGNGRASWGA
jgi:hypothetical protein